MKILITLLLSASALVGINIAMASHHLYPPVSHPSQLQQSPHGQSDSAPGHHRPRGAKTLTVDNTSTNSIVGLKWSYSGTTKTIPAGQIVTMDYSGDPVYELQSDTPQQSYGSLKQDDTYYVLSVQPMADDPAWQNLKITITVGDKSGWYQTVLNGSSPSFGGSFCAKDGTGITCNLGSSAPNAITLTVDGGVAPPPAQTYQYQSKGDFSTGVICQSPTYGDPMVYDTAKYNGQVYAACWYASFDDGDVPGKNPGQWAECNDPDCETGNVTEYATGCVSGSP